MDRILERDLEAIICYVLNIEGPLNTTQLRERVRSFLERHNELNQGDLEGLLNRNDEKVDQIIRNMVSHRYASGIIYEGLVDYQDGILSVTQDGIDVAERAIADTLK
ncbi:hypothetical protein MX111_05450 [Streptococcus uberis]|uniref:hypothetical protein n=1 Tax=Streptococcus uberis TaxID=1349 RepID=UPI0027DAD797|nr:hypothetical protein [Streptococcus uberis]MCK1238879.1 hypothetical protein [Streptococcus uberis]